MLRRLSTTLAPAALALLLMLPAGGRALESAWVKADKADVRLLAGGGPASLQAGVEIRLARGWHTYWRYAGDAGIPPRFDWSQSQNLAGAEVLWPAPARIAVEGGIESIGYKDDVLFPLRVRPADPEKPVALRLKLDFGVCEKICIPARAELALDLAPANRRPQPAIAAALARVPARTPLGEKNGLGVLAVTLERGAEPRALVDVAVPAGAPFDLFAEGPTEDWALPLPHRLHAGDGRARFALALDGAPGPGGRSPLPAKLRLTLVAGDRAVEVTVTLD